MNIAVITLFVMSLLFTFTKNVVELPSEATTAAYEYSFKLIFNFYWCG